MDTVWSILKKVLPGVGFVVLFILCGLGFRYFLVDDTESYTRLMMHEFYHQDNIDILFVGSSHCYDALDPAVTDDIFGKNTFNAGSAAQALDASFALIREASGYDVREVYLEMYYLMMTNDNYRDREQLTGTYIVSDYMRPSLNKARFLLGASSPKYYINSFLPARRNWEMLLHPSEIWELLKKKQTETYRYYLPIANYKAKGFVANTGTIPNGSLLLDNAGFDRIYPENASEDWIMTLLEIIRWCEINEIRLTLFSAPMTLFQTAGVGNYDEYETLIRGLIDGTDVRYVDFNRCRETYFDQKPEYFEDAGHLNQTGAAVFSRIFAEYFTGQIPEDELFYNSMAEKIAAADPRILGLSFLDSGDGMRKLKIVSTLPEGTIYTVVFTDENGVKTVLKEADDDPYFEVPQETRGTMTITAAGITVEIGVQP